MKLPYFIRILEKHEIILWLSSIVLLIIAFIFSGNLFNLITNYFWHRYLYILQFEKVQIYTME